MKKLYLAILLLVSTVLSVSALNYVTISGNVTNFTFQGDTTYYVTVPITAVGVTTFEGGAVIKYASNAAINLTNVVCVATPYRPVIFTSKDDNSVGQPISGSSGNPTNYYANPALSFTGPVPSSWTMSNFRISCAQQAIVADCVSFQLSLSDAQIVNCIYGILIPGQGGIAVHNVLFTGVVAAFNTPSYANFDVENCTFAGTTGVTNHMPAFLVIPNSYNGPFSIYLKNCILANMTQYVNGTLQGPYQTLDGDFNGFYNSPTPFGQDQITGGGQPFQSKGAGNYYLTTNSLFQNAGTTNIDPVLAADLTRKTTVPPTNAPPGGPTVNWVITATRDTDLPDLGYHYDPLDYMVTNFTLAGSPNTVANGVAIGMAGANGLVMTGGAGITFQGTADAMCHLVWYPSVQEEPVKLGNVSTVNSAVFGISTAPNTPKLITMQFTDVAMQGWRQPFFDYAPPYFWPYLTAGNSSFRGINLTVPPLYNAGTPASVISLQNNLLERCTVSLFNGYIIYFSNVVQNPLSVSLYNNLFWRGTVGLTYMESQDQYKPGWSIKDNAYDNSPLTFSGDGNYLNQVSYTNNGFLNYAVGAAPTTLRSSTDVPPSSGSIPFNYASIGQQYFYQASQDLVDKGSRNATSAGLSDFTTQTSLVPDGVSIVDIGYHYPTLPTFPTNPIISSSEFSTNFWLAELPAFGGGPAFFISSPVTTSGTLSVPGIAFSQPFSVVPGQTTTVDIHGQPVMPGSSDTVQPIGINITSGSPVTVDVFGSMRPALVERFLGYPTSMLGTNYYVMAHAPDISALSSIVVVAVSNNTVVTINASATANLTDQNGQPISNPRTVTLQQGDVYFAGSDFQPTSDVTGTHITANYPIGVFSGDSDSQMPDGNANADNPQLEQMIPVESWSRQTFGFPLAGRGNGDSYRVLAAYSNTVVTINGVQMWTLGPGDSRDFVTNALVEIRGSQPILAAQFGNGMDFDHPYAGLGEDSSDTNVYGDPMMMLLVPAGRFANAYVIQTPSWVGAFGSLAHDFINVIAEKSAIGSVKFDGQLVSNFHPIGGSGFYGAFLEITNAPNVSAHTITCPRPIGVQAYGFSWYDGYGSPAGVNVAPLVAVPDSFNIALNTQTNVDVLTNDIYVNRNNVTVTIPTGLGPAHGTAVVNGDKTISYTPANNFSGDDTFYYQIVENNRTNYTSAIMRVNDRNPVAQNDTVSTPFATPISINVLANDTDPDNDPRSILSVGPATNGFVWITATNTIKFAFTIQNGLPGSFSYTITDGRGGKASATVTVNQQ